MSHRGCIRRRVPPFDGANKYQCATTVASSTYLRVIDHAFTLELDL